MDGGGVVDVETLDAHPVEIGARARVAHGGEDVEQAEPGRLQPAGVAHQPRELREPCGDEAAAVEADGCAEGSPEGDEEGDAAAEAEADDADARRLDAGVT